MSGQVSGTLPQLYTNLGCVPIGYGRILQSLCNLSNAVKTLFGGLRDGHLIFVYLSRRPFLFCVKRPSTISLSLWIVSQVQGG